MPGPGPDRGALVAPTLVTPVGPLPVRGGRLGEPLELRPGAVAWERGVLTYVGPPEGLHGEAEVLEGATVAPGFVDCHTHLPFVGWRDDEYEARLAGRGYRDLHGEGGIPRSARMLAEAADEEVLGFSLALLREMAAAGTTAAELKTGYGLSVPGELRQARLARRLAGLVPQPCAVTLLACHAVPPGMRREAWVRAACEELIPAAAAEGLADAVDVWVEDVAFTVDDLRAVAEAARAHGLPLRCHAEQLGPSGAARVAAELGARSVDHLNHLGPDDARALAASETAAVLLPASTFLLRAPVPPARTLIEAGAIVALATDLNPGTSPVASMPEAIAIGCALYGLSPHEALTAATANAAWVLGLGERTGTLEVGKRADLVVLEGEAFRRVPYRPGHDPVVRAYAAGRRIDGGAS
ncbi:MAG TPA: imidazolonepropionase [Actinomycetota bacterium]|nr:imidazolonepropionase [Actinomycetota bacterium]